jgi:hypothetical protein
MLLDSLINETPEISIDSYLENPKTNSVGKKREKISFTLTYLTGNGQFKKSAKRISDFKNQFENFAKLEKRINIGSSLADLASFPLRMMFENKIKDEIGAKSRPTKLNYNKLISSNTCWQITIRIHQVSG